MYENIQNGIQRIIWKLGSNTMCSWYDVRMWFLKTKNIVNIEKVGFNKVSKM